MPVLIQRNDYDFILRCIKFYYAIDKYAEELDLDREILDSYKEDSKMLMHVFNNTEQYPSCAESFTHYMIDKMKNSFSYLAEACKSSENYTVSIGEELGIEIPVYAFLPS